MLLRLDGTKVLFSEQAGKLLHQCASDLSVNILGYSFHKAGGCQYVFLPLVIDLCRIKMGQ